jgi:hypothetical protein
MTNKDMSIAILDHIEKLESERATLIAFIHNLRDQNWQEFDLKQILSEHEVQPILDGVRAKHGELRQAILRATESNAALTLVQELLNLNQNKT